MGYIDDLTEYGLTRQEAAIYVELLKHGSMTGYEVSKCTGISKSNIYAALNGLSQKGAAAVEMGEASRYFPVDIHEFCDNYIRHLSMIKDRLIKDRPGEIVQKEGYLTIVSDRNIRDKIYDMLKRCESRLYIMAETNLLNDYYSELEKLTSAGKKVVILTQDEFELKDAVIYKTEVDKGQIRFITDSEYVLTGELSGRDDDTCLYSAQANLVEVMKEALKNRILLIQNSLVK